MGGYGSGWHRGRRRTVEEVPRLDVLEFHRARVEQARWAALVTLHHPGARNVGGDPEGITFAWTPCTFGGARPWFRCPTLVYGCGRRCRFLYQHGKFYVCRTCARLTYWKRQAHRNPSEEARAAGVSMWRDPPLDWRRDPIRRLLYRLARTRNPERFDALSRRMGRLVALREAEVRQLERSTAAGDRRLRRLGARPGSRSGYRRKSS